MKRAAAALLAAAAVLAWGGASPAQDFLMGEETGGIKAKGPENVETTIRILLQPRIDSGQIVTSEDAKTYSWETDLYLRRIRLETDTVLTPRLKLNFGLEADRTSQIDRNNQVRVRNAYLDYRFDDLFGVRFGRAQIPLSRVVITSSAKALLIENPASMEAAKKLFNDEVQAHLLLYGKVADGVFSYNLAAGDGWEPNSAIYSKGADNTVHKSGLLCMARAEVSPPGWVEKGQSDAPLGRGRHLKLGGHYAFQNGIEYKGSANEEDRTVWGVDLSGHLGGLVAQAEYESWTIDSTSPARGKVKPRGWYAQAGYFIAGPNVEPCARYEEYETDAGVPDSKQKIVTAGLNWYLKGHSVKVALDWARTEFGSRAAGALSADRRQQVIQLQAQLYL